MKYCPCSITEKMIITLSSSLSLDADRDLTYVRSRFEHEGLSFLTITLPSFASSIELAVEKGVASQDMFPAFAGASRGCLPKFLSGFTRRMFNDSGELMDTFDPELLYAIRQICHLWKKAEIPCSDTRVSRAFEKYVSTDEELCSYEDPCTSPDAFVRHVSGIVVRDVFANFNHVTLSGRHGPGATAERYARNERIFFRQWPIRAEPFFPSSFHAIPNAGWWDRLRGVELLSQSAEQPCRVVAVPKTLKTPRIIAVEPSYMQYMQQALLSYMTKRIESDPLTRQSIRFSDQSHNRESARKASITRSNATLDLSEASDRVHNKLVMALFGDSLLGKCLQACRSTSSVLPDGTSVQLQKFASMGSAVCFPVEALVFYILIQAAVHEHVGLRVTRKSIKNISKSISVYGDDLIVPVGWLSPVIKKLEAYGLKVNESKSFSRSHFRESCGGDYYNGYSVKPVYIRIDPSLLNGPVDVSTLISLCSYSNQFYDLGNWEFAEYLRTIVRSKTRYQIPYRNYESEGVYFKSVFRSTYTRYNGNLCRYESRTIVPRPVEVSDDISQNDVASTIASLRNIGNDRSVSLTNSARPHTLRQKYAWVR